MCAAIIGIIQRDHYDQPGVAFLTVLGVLTTSNWNSQYYSAAVDFRPTIIFYYIAWIFIGNWVLFNLFIAILIQGISEEKKNKFKKQEELVAEKVKNFFMGLSEEDLLKKIRSLFEEVDEDGSGMIDMNELETVLVEKCDVQLGPRDLIRLFKKYDDDDSGQINMQEFENMIRELLEISNITLQKLLLTTIKENFGGLNEVLLETRIVQFFQEADKDRSGFIDTKEMADLLANHDIEMMPSDLDNLLARTITGKQKGDQITQKEFGQMIRQLLSEAEGTAPALPLSSVLGPPQSSDPDNLQKQIQTVKALICKPSSDPTMAYPQSEPIQSGNPGESDNSGENGMPGEIDKPDECNKPDESDKQHSAHNPTDQACEGVCGELPGGGQLGVGASLERVDSAVPVADGQAVVDSKTVTAPVGNLARSGSRRILERSEDGIPRTQRALFCLGQRNPLRRACISFLEYPQAAPPNSKAFDNLIFVCIVVSSATLAFENPRISPESVTRQVLDGLNITLNFVFLLECCLKIVADSFHTYIRSGWNRLDFFIVVASTIDMILFWALSGQSASALRTFRTLRILRALRPLRLISRARNLRLLLTALWGSIFPILGTCAIAGVAFSMCSLLGMQLLRGKMKQCSDPTFVMKQDCLTNVNERGVPLKWESTPLNWDNLYRGIITMFILSSQDNWQVYMVCRSFLPIFISNLDARCFPIHTFSVLPVVFHGLELHLVMTWSICKSFKLCKGSHVVASPPD